MPRRVPSLQRVDLDLIAGVTLLQAERNAAMPAPDDSRNQRLIRAAEAWLLQIIQAAFPTSTEDADHAGAPYRTFVTCQIGHGGTLAAPGATSPSTDAAVMQPMTVDLDRVLATDLFPWAALQAALRRGWNAGAIIYALSSGMTVRQVQNLPASEALHLATLGGLTARGPIPTRP